MTSPQHPLLYQINTRVRLTELSQFMGWRATLDDIPDIDLDQIAELGFDWVWLLSVWQTGPTSREASRTRPEWGQQFKTILPDLTEEDICGSGFAIADYSVAENLGGGPALKRLRERLRQRGLKLMLDYVPNHMGLDHPWIDEHPEYFIRGHEVDLKSEPNNYTKLSTPRGDEVFAFGRDPYFPGWADTLQIDYSNPDAQQAMIEELQSIATLCDGLRCDMAMLVLPEVFERTWGKRTEPFWPTAIPAIREKHAEFCFMAEVYWDMEYTLQQQGFDFTYDKRLYDRLVNRVARPVREHLLADANFQKRSVRFLENHDEERAAHQFDLRVHEAAAAISYFVPGMRFFYQGQLEGRTVHVPPHLCRAPVEQINTDILTYYEQLLALLKQPVVHEGHWTLLECREAWDDNGSWDHFIVCSWENESGDRLVVAVNYSEHQSQCYVRLPFEDLAGHNWLLHDPIHGMTFERDGYGLSAIGLYLDMQPWETGFYFLRRSES